MSLLAGALFGVFQGLLLVVFYRTVPGGQRSLRVGSFATRFLPSSIPPIRPVGHVLQPPDSAKQTANFSGAFSVSPVAKLLVNSSGQWFAFSSAGSFEGFAADFAAGTNDQNTVCNRRSRKTQNWLFAVRSTRWQTCSKVDLVCRMAAVLHWG